jgi:hypothetical protein
MMLISVLDRGLRFITKVWARVSIAIIVTLMLLMNAGPAAAHAGHAHAEAEGGFTIIPTLEVAGTVAVLAIAYLLANRIYRGRDGSVAGRPGEHQMRSGLDREELPDARNTFERVPSTAGKPDA